MNLSLGAPASSGSAILQAVSAASTAGRVHNTKTASRHHSTQCVLTNVLGYSGITILAAAGNNAGDACSLVPASSGHVITVGSTGKSDDFSASFSNYGSCVDILAPGTPPGRCSVADAHGGLTLACAYVNRRICACCFRHLCLWLWVSNRHLHGGALCSRPRGSLHADQPDSQPQPGPRCHHVRCHTGCRPRHRWQHTQPPSFGSLAGHWLRLYVLSPTHAAPTLLPLLL